MNRKDLLNRYEGSILKFATERFEIEGEDIHAFDAYEGCANLVYACKQMDRPVILRVSYSQDRSYQQILAELDFIQYLAQNGVRVAEPIPSIHGKLIEELQTGETSCYFVCFTKGPGSRVPDNNYRYRQDAPIEEYFQNWGAMLGKMHALSKQYHFPGLNPRRPDWFQLHARKLDIDSNIPNSLPLVKRRVSGLLDQLTALPKDFQGYGLIHGDFNDGNFTVDYTNGNITVFDFDDCCYFWFAYELAAAWEGGIGRVMFENVDKRKNFMDRYMGHVLTGYTKWNILPDEWLEKIPLFIRVIQVEEFLHYVQYIQEDNKEIQSHLKYLITCIEQDLPYMGFFDRIYSHNHPFSL